MGIILIVLGIAAAAYGVSVMMIWSGTSFFLVWHVIGAALGGTGALVQLGIWRTLPAALRYVVTGGALCVAAAIAIAASFVVSQAVATPPADLDAIIVLGAQVRSDGKPSAVLEYRLDAALAYLRDNPRTICVVSGGQGPNEPTTEAACMAAWLEDAGIDPERIRLEDKSTNTVQNIAFSKELLDSPHASVGVVTNNFHCFRAGRIALAQGLDNSCTIAAWSTPWYFANNVLRESMGLIKDKLCGNI